MYIKKLYADDPLFENTKVIYSVFNNGYKGKLSDNIIDKLLFEDLNENDLADNIECKYFKQVYNFLCRCCC